jgi:hypothetical protein
MFHRTLALIVRTLALIVVLIGTFVGTIAQGAQAIPGTYEISFFSNGQDITPYLTLLVGDELVLQAHVTDAALVDAQRGAVTFQYCSLQGGRSLTQTDPAPSAACDLDGTGTWISVVTFKVDAGTCPWARSPGYACVDFGAIRSPRTVGFRFRYTGQGSGIASATSAAKDVSWVTP